MDQWYRAIFECFNDAVVLIDPSQDKIIEGNPRACELLGFQREALLATHFSSICVNKLSDLQAFFMLGSENKGMTNDQFAWRTREGSHLPLEISASKFERDGKTYIIASLRDITDRKQAAEFHHLSNIVFNTATEGIIVTDDQVNIISVNPAFTQISGYTGKEVIGKKPSLFRSDKHDKVFFMEMWNAILSIGHWEGEIWNKRKSGEVYPSWISITAVKNEHEKITHYTALFSDITKMKKDEEKLYFQANFDGLTGLPNRTLALEELEKTINAIQNKDKAALLLVGLDRFTQVNDTISHSGGDKILQKVAKRLLSCVRQDDTVARIGGDEFLIILPDARNRDKPVKVAERIITSMSDPFHVDRRDIFLSASIGVTIIPDDGSEVLGLLKNADLAISKAKKDGRNRYRFFNTVMETDAKAHALMEWDLRKGLLNKEFILHYQPVVDIKSLRTITLEALIRWNHPNKGLVPPGKFIPIAEESELISQMGEMILETGCRQVNQWRTRHGYKGSININVSTRQIVYSDFQAALIKALNNSGLPPERLTLEVTESLMLDPKEDPFKKLQKLKEIGVKIAIDDFGTGYSSLSYLWRYPIDYLKIDRSFISHIETDINKQHLVEVIIQMGQTMKMKVVAEGVETSACLKWLESSGCDSAQGFLISKPVSADCFETMLSKGDRIYTPDPMSLKG
ncbi:MAG: EAL domain-containing protein [Nitrospiria bacterium]